MSKRETESGGVVCVAPCSAVETAEGGVRAEAVETVKETCKLSRESPPAMHSERAYFYCAQPHELDETLLLNRRREIYKRE
jgi:hypothetical protein